MVRVGDSGQDELEEGVWRRFVVVESWGERLVCTPSSGLERVPATLLEPASHGAHRWHDCPAARMAATQVGDDLIGGFAFGEAYLGLLAQPGP